MIQTQIRDTRRAGFTLVELLVVIGIIVVLIGITLPVLHRVQIARYRADTSNEIAQISNACTQYEQTFKAFPGPLSNDQIEGSAKSSSPTVPLPALFYLSVSGTYRTVTPTAPNGTTWNVTGDENLVLGLMGGLRPYPNNPAGIVFAPSEVGLGPLSLNSLNPTRTPSFMPTGANYLLWCQQVSTSSPVVQNSQYDPSSVCVRFSDGASSSLDSPIPEFADRFPSQLPILYLRARTSAKGIVSDGAILDPILSITAQYQYDVREITAYTQSSIGRPAGGQGHGLQSVAMFQAAPNSATPLSIKYTNPPNQYPIANAGPYFNDPSNTPSDVSSDASFNYTGRPHAVDQFILIAAGADGIYGTPDDIVSFGDVSP